MYLTRIELDPHKRLARKFLGSPQAMHAVVMKAVYASETAKATSNEGRTLWRIDHGSKVYLYIVSPNEPDCSQILVEAGTTGTCAVTHDYTTLLNRLKPGQLWAFRLTANPAKAHSQGAGIRGKVHGYVSIEQQLNWLLDRASMFGFEILKSEQETPPGIVEIPNTSPLEDEDRGSPNPGHLLVVRREKPRFGRRRPGEEKKDRVTINRVTFEGQLRVSDPIALRAALTKGIGRSKAYGCGLMTLAPIKA